MLVGLLCSLVTVPGHLATVESKALGRRDVRERQEETWFREQSKTCLGQRGEVLEAVIEAGGSSPGTAEGEFALKDKTYELDELNSIEELRPINS